MTRSPPVIAGCSRRKLQTAVPVPALDLYQGGCIPALRAKRVLPVCVFLLNKMIS